MSDRGPEDQRVEGLWIVVDAYRYQRSSGFGHAREAGSTRSGEAAVPASC